MVKNLPVNTGDVRDMGSHPASGRSPGGGHGNPLQYSCLQNPHGQSLVGCSPWGRKGLDMTEQLRTACKHSKTYKKNHIVISIEAEKVLEKNPVFVSD